MSFGIAAQGRPLSADAPCPCGGGAYGDCCGPVVAGDAAATAEQLMRSRFTAFALGHARHVRDSWHPSTAPASVDLDDGLRWDRLDIVRTDEGQPGDRRGVVEFVASWHDPRTGESGRLHEVSRFRFALGRWYYLDGEVDADR